MNSLNDCSLETTCRQQVRQCTPVSKRVDRETGGRCIIQIVFQPLMSLDQLVDHCVNMDIRFVRHDPATSGDFESTRLDELL